MILNAMASSVLALDGELRVVFVNPAAEQLFGASRTVLENRPLAELVPFDSSLFDLIRRVQLAGNSVSDYGVELPLNRSVTRLVDLHVSPLAERAGHCLAVLHPCSVAHRLNHQLTHRGGARSVAGLGATLAHEVKNPLSGIRGAAQLLEPGVADDERPLIRLICDETDRICALVDRMEQFADRGPIARRPGQHPPGAGARPPPRRERLRAQAALRGALRPLAARGRRRPRPAGPGVPQPGQERRRGGAARTAARSGSRPSTPTASRCGSPTAASGSSCRSRCRSRTTDPGVSAEIVGHLFEPFVSTKRAGSGLGLSLVAKIVGDHGGVVEFANQPRGTVFRVRLPAYRGAGRARRSR